MEQMAAEIQAKADAEQKKLEDLNRTSLDLQQKLDAIQKIQSSSTLTEQQKKQEIRKLLGDVDSIRQLEDQKKSVDQAIAAQTPITTKAQSAAEAAKAQADKARSAADGKQGTAPSKKEEAQAAQRSAEDALQNALDAQKTVEVQGNLSLNAKGDVGTPTAPIDMDLGGNLNLKAGGNAGVANEKDLNLESFQAGGDIAIHSLGSVSQNPGSKPVSGGKAQISALGGDAKLNTSIDRISGVVSGNAAISNDKGLTVDDLNAGGRLDLDVQGPVHAGDAAPGTGHITASDLHLTAKGHAGSSEKPLHIFADQITAHTGDLNLHSGKDLIVNHISGRDITIHSDGRLNTGKPENGFNIRGENVDLKANGDIGRKDAPLLAGVTGKAVAESVFNHVYWLVTVFGGQNAKNQLQAKGITLRGVFSDCAELEVQLIDSALAQALAEEMELVAAWMNGDSRIPQAREDHWDMMWPCESCTRILSHIAEGKALAAFRLDVYCGREPSPVFGWQELTKAQRVLHELQDLIQIRNHRTCFSKAEISIDLYALLTDYQGELEGQILYAEICAGGEYQVLSAAVENGTVTFNVNSLGDGHFLMALLTEKP